MHVIQEQSAQQLLTDARDLLLQHEVENATVLAILEAVCGGRFAEPPPWLWSVREDEQLMGVAVRTPPLPLNLSRLPPAAGDAIAVALLQGGLLPLELTGPRAEVDAVLAGLARRARTQTQVFAELRQFELRAVTPAPPTSGAMRSATAQETELLISLLDDFTREATPQQVGQFDQRAVALRMIELGAAFFWEDQRSVVSLAAWRRRVGRGVAIAPVFTPPAQRGRGYATALVAALSQHLLDTGCAYICLATDLANPTSNSIYPKVGYRPLGDARYVGVRAV